MSGLRLLVVDDESLARERLVALLATMPPGADLPIAEIAEAASTAQALQWLDAQPVDVVLLDIRMPGTDGLALARTLRHRAQPPAVVFVTAHGQYALQGFELEVADYLTKPVRQDRLRTALLKATRLRSPARALPDGAPVPGGDLPGLVVRERGRIERVPLAQVLYLQAEGKYLTLRTAAREWVMDGSLQAIEQQHGAHLVRVHRSMLVTRWSMRALERQPAPADGSTADATGESWWLRLEGLAQPVPVSRRQLLAVRQALGAA